MHRQASSLPQSEWPTSPSILPKARSLFGYLRNCSLTRWNRGLVQPGCQPAKDSRRHQPRGANQTEAEMTVWHSPDVGLPPLAPEFLDRRSGRQQIMHCFDQQYVLLGDGWLLRG